MPINTWNGVRAQGMQQSAAQRQPLGWSGQPIQAQGMQASQTAPPAPPPPPAASATPTPFQQPPPPVASAAPTLQQQMQIRQNSVGQAAQLSPAWSPMRASPINGVANPGAIQPVPGGYGSAPSGPSFDPTDPNNAALAGYQQAAQPQPGQPGGPGGMMGSQTMAGGS